jgi:predicted nucleotidyltransferase
MRDWPVRVRAEQLRHWPTLSHIAERVEAIPALDGLLAIGSFAAGQPDELSDLDLVVVVAEDRFEEAWEQRADLETRDALTSWDRRPDPNLAVGGHRFLTRDIVKVELLMSTPSGGARLADPYVVLVGEEMLGERFPRLKPIPREELEQYAQKLRDEGTMPKVESLYGDLMTAIREARAKATTGP